MKMEFAAKMFIRVRESVVRSTRGQTMTEYALILAAIAVVVYGTYKALGNSTHFSSLSGVDSIPTSAYARFRDQGINASAVGVRRAGCKPSRLTSLFAASLYRTDRLP